MAHDVRRGIAGDFPDVGEDDMFHDLLLNKQYEWDKTLWQEVCRTKLGWVPSTEV